MQAISVRNRALLAGSGWTLAAAAGLAFCLKSSAAEPIYLWSLGVVALGWAGVALRALAAERRAAGAAIAAASEETRAVIDVMAQAMGEQMRRAGTELVGVDELLAHAIELLMVAFDSVSEHAQIHQNEFALALEYAAQGTRGAERLRAAAERVAQDVNGAVTALQFRDVVGQKLGHVRLELEALESVMRRIRAASRPAEGLVVRPAPPQPGLAECVRALLRELQIGKANSPAQQEMMHAGEVELF